MNETEKLLLDAESHICGQFNSEASQKLIARLTARLAYLQGRWDEKELSN